MFSRDKKTDLSHTYTGCVGVSYGVRPFSTPPHINTLYLAVSLPSDKAILLEQSFYPPTSLSTHLTKSLLHVAGCLHFMV